MERFIVKCPGPTILEDCKVIVAKQGCYKTSEAVIITGGNLKANLDHSYF